jgi:hypothetical protein
MAAETTRNILLELSNTNLNPLRCRRSIRLNQLCNDFAGAGNQVHGEIRAVRSACREPTRFFVNHRAFIDTLESRMPIRSPDQVDDESRKRLWIVFLDEVAAMQCRVWLSLRAGHAI